MRAELFHARLSCFIASVPEKHDSAFELSAFTNNKQKLEQSHRFQSYPATSILQLDFILDISKHGVMSYAKSGKTIAMIARHCSNAAVLVS